MTKFRVVREIRTPGVPRYLVMCKHWDGYLHAIPYLQGLWRPQRGEWELLLCARLFERVTGIHLKPGEWTWVEMREVE